MTNNKEELLNILQNLKHDEFKILKWFLKQDNILEGFPGIPAAQFKVRGNRQETVDLMTQQYDGPGALEVTLKVLEKINRNDLVQHLQNSSSGGKDLKTHYVGAEAEEFNIQEKLVQQFAVDVTSDPDTAHPDLLSADGRQVHPERCRRSVIVLELLVVFVGVCLICRVVYFKTHSVGAHTEEGNLKQANLMVTQQFAECKTQLNQLNETLSILGNRVNSITSVTHKAEGGNLKQAKLMVVQQFAVDVTLDPDTAHPNLILSDDGKQVYDSDVKKKLPNNPERFNETASILGKQGFIKRKFYFEVQVKGKTAWSLGVAKESINRKGDIFLGPGNGFWTMWLRNGEYKAKDSPPVRLSLKSPPEKIGVFVDYEEGLVSFYDVDTADLLYSFTNCSFTETIYPYFSPSVNFGGKNSAPLIISPVNLKD